jgi:hypothetical protein
MIEQLADEVIELLKSIDLENEGPTMIYNYQKVAAKGLRLSEMHNDIALMEIYGTASNELKRLRTMVIDPTIERIDKIAAYESRKITAKGIERDLERG